ncbi:DUF1841 family protein [Legionella fairfieldensis]|uniref:DUF1841 family protein n=1 Tax=Legionella fairfieldensis TaxID=45064 RepID=UPI00048F3BF6|nr:DUF1841 family protein [Legionella fairfieldensis]
MFYGNTIQDTRQLFFTSWQKYQQKQRLEAVEHQIVNVILDHPEYQPMLELPAHLEHHYFPELGQTNPFLHMGLHLAIRDQVTTNTPLGIKEIYKKLLRKYGKQLAAEHFIMDILAEHLWKAQRSHTTPDERSYLDALAELL